MTNHKGSVLIVVLAVVMVFVFLTVLVWQSRLVLTTTRQVSLLDLILVSSESESKAADFASRFLRLYPITDPSGPLTPLNAGTSVSMTNTNDGSTRVIKVTASRLNATYQIELKLTGDRRITLKRVITTP